MFLPIKIDEWGYMWCAVGYKTMVHKETRNLHQKNVVSPTLDEAKARCYGADTAVLELTPEGGGSRIWVFEGEESTMRERVANFKSCYGAWDISTMTRRTA